MNFPPIAVNSTRVYISLRCCLSGPAVRFRRRAGGFQRPAKWLKWCTSLLFFFFCFLSSLFIWSLLFDSFIPHTIDSSVNRLCGLISTWPPIPDERILQFTSSRTVDQRFPILFFLFSFFIRSLLLFPPPFFRSESRLFLLRDSSPLLLCSPFSLFAPSSSQDARKTNRRALRHVLY